MLGIIHTLRTSGGPSSTAQDVEEYVDLGTAPVSYMQRMCLNPCSSFSAPDFVLIFWYSYFKCVCLFHLYCYLDPFPQVFIVRTGEQLPGLPWGLHFVALISFQCHIIFSFHARFFSLWDYVWPSGSLSVAIRGIRVQIHGSNSDPKSLFEVIVSYLFEWHLGSGGDRVMLVARLQIPEPQSFRHYSELLIRKNLDFD